MFARGVLSFHPARSPVSGEFFLSPTIPALAPSSCKSSYSRTYRIPSGGGIYRFPCQTHSTRSFLRTQLSALFPFNHLLTLSFSVAHLSPVSPVSSALFPQNRGCTPPLVQPIAFLCSTVRSFPFSLSCRLSTVGCLLLPSHSPAIHNPVTAPSPIFLPLLSQ
jgi:hypothetical protein